MQQSFVFVGGVKGGGHAFKYNDIIVAYNVNNPALDIREAFFDAGRLNMVGLERRQAKLLELIGILSRTGSHTDDCIDHLCRWDGKDTFFRCFKSGVGIIPWSGSDGKTCLKIQHHAP